VAATGSVYLMTSIGVNIYRRRQAVLSGEPVGATATIDEVEGCHRELSEVRSGLEKHLDGFHTLIGHYDASTAQQWADAGAFWRGQWKLLGDRCRFGERRAGPFDREMQMLADVHAELRETEAIYTKELLRFGRDQAPRMDRITQRIDKLGDRLAKARQKIGGGVGEQSDDDERP